MDVRQKQKKRERLQAEMKALAKKRSRLLAKLQKDMFQAVVSLAKEQNFDLIMSQGVVYSSDKVDITDSVLKKLQK